MDTEKQRQRTRDDSRLTESGDARSEQLLVMPTESLLTNGEWLPGGLLSGWERRRSGWFLDMKYQSCPYFIALPPLINVANTRYHSDGDSTSFLASHPWQA